MRQKYLDFILAEKALNGEDFDQQMEFVLKTIDEDQWKEAAISLIYAYSDGIYKIKDCVHYNHPVVQEAITYMHSVVTQSKISGS